MVQGPTLINLLLDCQSHLPRRTLDDAHCPFNIAGIQVGHLFFRYLAYLRSGHAAHFFLQRFPRALRDACRFLEKFSSRRCLQDKDERAILKDSQYYRDDLSHVLLRGIVEFRAKVLDVHSVRPERGADRRRWIRLSARQLQLDDYFDWFCHISFAVCSCITRGEAPRLYLLNLQKIELDRCFPSEHGDEHLHLAASLVYRSHLPFVSLERSVDNLRRNADFHVDLVLGLLAAHAAAKLLYLGFRNRCRRCS